MNAGFQMERISKERLKDLIPLYKNAFSKNVSLNYFQKKFDTKIFGAEYIGFIAYAKEQAAAYYGLFPCQVMYEGKILLSAVSGDTMTHTEHRGKGLFVELSKRTFLLAKESGVKFAYGFPNQNSLKGSIDSGWKYLGDHLKNYTIKIKTIPVSRITKKLNLGRLSSVNESEQFSNSLSGKEGGCVLHDKNYFNYKSYSSKLMIAINGVKVWCKLDGILKIGDVERVKNFDITNFLDGLRAYAFKRGIPEIQFVTSNGTWLDTELAKKLEGRKVFPVAHYDLDADGIDLSKMKYGMCDLDTF